MNQHMEGTKPKILVVDDTPANLVAMRRLLSKVDAELVEANGGNEALAATLEHEFALILLDVQMPDIDGFEVASLLSEEESTRDTPLIFVTAASSDELNRLRGYRSGAVDYITKPINDMVLLSKVNIFLDLFRGRRELEVLLARLAEQNKQLEIEVTERRRLEALARHQAGHDPLTGLPNRMLFHDRLATAIERSHRSGHVFALAYIDIDGFKPVNDQHGHDAGDELLKSIAQRMRTMTRTEDTVARLGGDEFAVIMEGFVDQTTAALRLAEDICVSLREPYQLSAGEPATSVEVEVGASLGLALFPTNAVDADGLVRAADRAMYAAKRGGKNRCVGAD